MGLLQISVFIYLLIAVYCNTIRETKNAKEELEEYIAQAKLNVNQRYRLQYHVAGPVGWVNDPNGFSYYKGQYHLFYQFYPYDSKWGPMHWGHVTSKDLVHWEQQPTALIPGKEMCFSGSAVVDGDKMVLIYTGHEIIEQDPQFNQTQYLAFSTDGVNFEKYEGNPVIPSAPNATPDFRDPKAWRHGDFWYVIIGSKTLDNRGNVLLYKSKDLINWEFLTVLAEANGEQGYMWECPDFFELDGKHILLLSPQGMEPQGDRYKNTHQTGYIVGHFDYETHQFVKETDFQELDYGHDFYAAQTTEVNGRRLLIGWFGMWEVPYPEDVDGWACAQTLVRELRLDSNNRIHMSPVHEQMTLRGKASVDNDFGVNKNMKLDAATELLIKGDLDLDIDLLLEGVDGGSKAWIRWDSKAGKVVVEREGGDVRQVEWVPGNERSWRLFLDTSSLELFCGSGEVVFSSRLYPLGGWKLTNVGSQSLRMTSFGLQRGVPV